MSVVVKGAVYFIFHVPDFVQCGSKPYRDIQEEEKLRKHLTDHLRSYEEVINYASHQAFIGNIHPDKRHMPILEDVIAGVAFLITKDEELIPYTVIVFQLQPWVLIQGLLPDFRLKNCSGEHIIRFKILLHII